MQLSAQQIAEAAHEMGRLSNVMTLYLFIVYKYTPLWIDTTRNKAWYDSTFQTIGCKGNFIVSWMESQRGIAVTD